MFDSAETLAADLEAFARRTGDANIATASSPWTASGTRVETEAGRLILLLAAGKPTPVPGVDASDAERIRGLAGSARRVVSEVFLAPGADYFLNLGVGPDATNDEIREHFRRLMAIVHPDAQPVGFPPDAAVRVNRAYGVLSNLEERTLYADSLVASPRAIDRKLTTVDVVPPASRRQNAGTRWAAVLAMLRSRQTLLWSAVLLLLPVVFLLLSGLRQNEPVRLVEARRSEPAAAAPQSTPSLRDATGVAASGSALAGIGAQPAATSPSQPTADSEVRIGGMSLTGGLSDRSLARIAAPRVATSTVAENRRKPPAENALAPTAAISSAGQDAPTSPIAPQAPTSVTASQHTGNAAEPSSRASAGLRDGPSVPVNAPALTSVGGGLMASNTVSTSPAAATAVRAAQVPAAAATTRSGDIDDLLVRFASAYESGSIANFAQLFSTSMAGRRQMLREYERMFSSTQSRSIKFNQFKHSVTGDRIATSGYATVTTTDQDNRTATQRVFLEFEIGRDRGEPRIERLSNYAIN